jgi:hypothetical protein
MLFVSERVTIRRVAGPATAANGKTLKSAIVAQSERIISFPVVPLSYLVVSSPACGSLDDT